MKKKFLMLGMCMLITQNVYTKSESPSVQISHTHPELSGLINLAPPIKATNDKIFRVPQLGNQTIEIDTITEYKSKSFAFHLSHALHLGALLTCEPDPTLERFLAFEIVSRHFQLRYFDSLSPSDQRKCKQELLARRCTLDYHLIGDYQRIPKKTAAKEKTMDLLIEHVITRYRENREVINALDKAAAMAIRALDLAQPTHMIMALGGDHRLVLNKETGVNKYYAAPRTDFDTLMRSNSTTSFLTEQAFIIAEQERIDLLLAGLSGILDKKTHQSFETIRTKIKQTLNVPNQTYTILTPCGTSSEMIMTLLGLAKHKSWSHELAQEKKLEKPLLINILTASKEVGSKSSCAAQLCHVSELTPSGTTLQVKAFDNGLPNNTLDTILLHARDNHTGNPIDSDELENDISHIIERAIKRENQSVILHFVHASKTGITTPSLTFIQDIKEKYGNKVIIVVDAAQMRCNPEDITSFLEKDFCVMITGSKLLAGAPFSGALLIPPSQVKPLLRKDLYVPADFSLYFNASESDNRLTRLKDQLPSKHNYGLLLRWKTALCNMESFYAIPRELRSKILGQWVTEVKSLIAQKDRINMLETDKNIHNVNLIGNTNTIISITLSPEGHNRLLTINELKSIHKLLTQNITPLLPTSISGEEKTIAQTKILIGQPVQLSKTQNNEISVLRLSVNAPIVADIADSETTYNSTVKKRLEKELETDKVVLSKLNLLMKYYNNIIPDIIKT